MSVYVFVLKERIIPSFETETYETSFIKFDYPASWFEQSFDYNFVLFAKSNRPDIESEFRKDIREKNKSRPHGGVAEKRPRSIIMPYDINPDRPKYKPGKVHISSHTIISLSV